MFSQFSDGLEKTFGKGEVGGCVDRRMDREQLGGNSELAEIILRLSL